jgi:integrase/recombinase XerD
VTQLRKKMLEELQRRNYSQTTVKSYLRIVAAFAQHYDRPPDQLGSDEICAYQAYLFTKRKLRPHTVSVHTAALRFINCKYCSENMLSKKCPIQRHLAACRSSSQRKK